MFWRVRQRLREARGILRSLRIYYGGRAHRESLAALYRQFLKPGDLAFDIGAHVGDRTAAFLRLGCHVVAAEPQPAAYILLRLLYGANCRAVLLKTAVSDTAGSISLRINSRNPTVSTASPQMIESSKDDPLWQGQSWDTEIMVEAVTLDMLIARFGMPAFIKIDVEGFEDRVLAGLSTAPPALSFEFTTIQRDVARRSLARLETLGTYRFNASLGESHELLFVEWQNGTSIAAWLGALPASANSGDIYAVLEPANVSMKTAIISGQSASEAASA